DETENRALGRAYLGHMFRRYGSWPDASPHIIGDPDIWTDGSAAGGRRINFPPEWSDTALAYW
ncbi:MAG TPA: hypothetical protein VGF39_04140, partial [Stellaceae bacterium]